MPVKRPLKIGTRGSPLALKQTQMVVAGLRTAHPDLDIETIVIKTSGDWRPGGAETRLDERQGGKALFAKEIEEALLAGTIHAGIHSMKDMDSRLPDGLVINHMLPRADARDVLIARDEKIKTIAGLPQGARVGTCSLRRQAFLLHQRPDLKIEILRGNVGTRLEKLKTGQVDATLLACAGLQRLGMDSHIKNLLSLEDMLPAAGQGAIGIEMREGDLETAVIFNAIACETTFRCVKAERAALAALQAGCRTPIGAYAELKNHDLHLQLALATPDGHYLYKDEASGAAITHEDVENIGHALALRMKNAIPVDILVRIL